ncbi:hypothetical protein AB2B38_009580, partial [Balneola sp. MJW-20]
MANQARIVIILCFLISTDIVTAQDIPLNAQKKSYGNGWECNDGYYKEKFDSEGCKKVPVPENGRLYLG